MDTLHTIPRTNGQSPPAPPLIATSRAPGGTVVVHLAGELDQDRQPAVEHALARALGSRPLRLVIDMAGVPFCDCAGLHALLKTRHAAQQTGIDLQLAGLRRQARRLLEITQTDALFTTTDNALHRTPGSHRPSTPAPRPENPGTGASLHGSR